MWRWGALIGSLVGDTTAREIDRARPSGGTAGRPNGNRTNCSPQNWQRLCNSYTAPMYGAERSAPLQEIVGTVSRALACLADRLIWPCCLPLMAEMCLKLREDFWGAHEACIRCATHNGANLILSGLYDRLARLLGQNLANGTVRDHPPRNRFGNSKIASVQDWLAISGMPQPLVQKWECYGSSTRPSVRTHRGSHPARSARPRGGGPCKLKR